MSLFAEILDRLSGVNTLRDRTNEQATRLEKLAAGFMDHEKRLLRLEIERELTPPQKGTKRIEGK
jgi:hypothetical protein